MREITLPTLGTVAAWRDAARSLAGAGVGAEDVVWRVGADGRDLFAGYEPPEPALCGARSSALRLSRRSLQTIETALYHSDPQRFARAYDIVLRLSRGQLRWGDRSDPNLRKLLAQHKTVRRDVHKMHAFVRFREVPGNGTRRAFAAWFEPEHPVVEIACPFFARRFGDMDWVIVTPSVTARFVSGALEFVETESGSRPPEDSTEDLWRTYYASIFNPARLMVKAMQSEMPKKYWRNLPEARLIPELIRTAPRRAAEMQAAQPTEPPARRTEIARRMAARADAVPEGLGGIQDLREEAGRCTRCPLHRCATQVVFGEGPVGAKIMVVGEQPGDREDLVGRPFVGPAGILFDEEAQAAGLDRTAIYVTNAVKHFKFTPRGKRRIHQRPNGDEIAACRWWLDRERAMVQPQLIVAMGATACEALLGSGAGLLKRRSGFETTEDGTPVLITVHPAFVLRLPNAERRSEEQARFRADLTAAADFMRQLGGAGA